MEERLEGIQTFWFQMDKLSTLQAAIEQIMKLSESEKLKISSALRNRYLNRYSFKAISEKYKVITKQFIK